MRKKKRPQQPFIKNKFLLESSPTTKKREKQAAVRFDSEAQPGSGATPWAKEDLKGLHFLSQHKHTKKNSHRIVKEDLQELERNAIDEGKEGAYIIDFDGEEYVTITKRLFDEAFR